MAFNGVKGHNYSELIEGKDSREIESDIINYIVYLKNKHHSLATQKMYLAALIHFFSINDVLLRRKKISNFLSNDEYCPVRVTGTGSGQQEQQEQEEGEGNNDKPYSREQISKLLSFADLRTKAIILLMCSSGMRLGGLTSLRYGDLTPIPAYGIYQIRVYANSKSNRHFTFCTPECRNAVDNYIEFRKSCGEVITAKSPLIRRWFDKRDVFTAARDIKPVTESSIKRAVTNVLYASGLRIAIVTAETESESQRLNYRRATALTHGYRKFFDTTCTNAGMNGVYIEWCMGHKLKGVKDSYFLPQPNAEGIYVDVLEGNEKSPGYLDAIDWLTIDDSNRLKRENEMLKVKKSEYQYLKEQIEATKRDQQKYKDDILKYLKTKMGIPDDVNEITLSFDTSGKVHDLDKELGY